MRVLYIMCDILYEDVTGRHSIIWVGDAADEYLVRWGASTLWLSFPLDLTLGALSLAIDFGVAKGRKLHLFFLFYCTV